MRARLLVGLRIGVAVGLVLAGVGLGGLLTDTGVWLTAALGPTAYLLVAHPRDATARARNALVGHVIALASGLLALAVFGLWDAPSVAETHHESWSQIAAQAVAVALTLLVLTLVDAHHAPAGATALLVSSGIAAPGEPLLGLVVGLAIVLVLAPLVARLTGDPSGRRVEADATR